MVEATIDYWNDRDDVYRVYLQAGEQLTATESGTECGRPVARALATGNDRGRRGLGPGPQAPVASRRRLALLPGQGGGLVPAGREDDRPRGGRLPSHRREGSLGVPQRSTGTLRAHHDAEPRR